MGLFSCPHCGLSIQPRFAYLGMDYCPRCLAQRHVAEALTAVEDSRNRLDPAQNRPEQETGNQVERRQ